MDRDRIEQRLRAFFAHRGEGPSAVYLFGSVARGSARSASDIDVAVLHPGAMPGTLGSLALDLEGELERALGLPVQVVVLDRAPVDLVHRVLRDGILVHEGDRGERIRFEVGARSAYLDLLPVLLEYRRGARSPAGRT